MIANGESVHTLISSEGSRSDERHRETTETIVAKQDEIHTEVIESLQSLDSSARAEQEATRRELEQLKQAMAQIEQDMRRRDEELKELLQALSCSHNKKERKALQERSNAVTIALYALMTIYESLQHMLVALQAHAKSMLTSSINIWGVKSGSSLRSNAKRSILDAIEDKPIWLIEELAIGWDAAEQIRYSISIGALFATKCSIFHPTCTVEFYAHETMKFNNITHEDILDRGDAKEEICRLAELLDGRLSNSQFSSLDIDNLKSLVILTTFLAELYNLRTVSDILVDYTSRTPTSRDIFLWSSLGQIAGFKRAAASAIISRLDKWGLPEIPSMVNHTERTKGLVRWITGEVSTESFSFTIGGMESPALPHFTWADASFRSSIADATRAVPAVHYALIEYLIEFGFPFTPPVIEIGPQGPRARVYKKVLDTAIYTQRPRELPESGTLTPYFFRD